MKLVEVVKSQSDCYERIMKTFSSILEDSDFQFDRKKQVRVRDAVDMHETTFQLGNDKKVDRNMPRIYIYVTCCKGKLSTNKRKIGGSEALETQTNKI